MAMQQEIMQAQELHGLEVASKRMALEQQAQAQQQEAMAQQQAMMQQQMAQQQKMAQGGEVHAQKLRHAEIAAMRRNQPKKDGE
jgi:hypothetical protein